MTSRGVITRRSDTHIYYDAVISNPEGSQQLVLSTFQDQRGDVIIERPEKYHLSLIRFEVPTSVIPQFVFKDNTYFVTLRFSGTDFIQPVVWISNDLTSTTSRNILNYFDWLNMVNTALASAFTALKAAFPAAPPTNAPQIIFDPPSGIFSYFVDDSYDPVVAGAPTIEIWNNTALYSKFLAFWINFNGLTETALNRKNFQIVIKSLPNNTNTTTHKITMSQQGAALGASLDPQAVVFTSSNLPVRSEVVPITNTGYSTSSATTTFKKILTDFTIPVGGNSQDGGSTINAIAYQYLPTAEYRLIDMIGSSPLTQVDLAVFWQSKDGTLNPFFIGPNQTLTAKFLFRKKQEYLTEEEKVAYNSEEKRMLEENKAFSKRGGYKNIY